MSNVVSIHPYFKTHEGKLEAFKKKTNYWNIKGSIETIQVYAPGRAPENGSRKP